MLGYLMYRSGLVPRPIAVLGLIGGTLAFAAATAELFGLWPQVSGGRPPGAPGSALRGVLGIYLTLRDSGRPRLPRP